MKETIFTGAAVALVTPFNPDMSVNYEELEKLIEFQITSGTDAIVTCGTTGEAATLNDEEQVKVIEFMSLIHILALKSKFAKSKSAMHRIKSK